MKFKVFATGRPGKHARYSSDAAGGEVQASAIFASPHRIGDPMILMDRPSNSCGDTELRFYPYSYGVRQYPSFSKLAGVARC